MARLHPTGSTPSATNLRWRLRTWGILAKLRALTALALASYIVLLAVLRVTAESLDPGEWLGLGALLAVAGSATLATLRRRPAVLDGLEASLLLAASVPLESPQPVEFVFLLAAANAALHRGLRARVAALAAFGAALATAWLLAVDDLGIVLGQQLPRLVLVVLLFGFVRDIARFAEDRLVEERLLSGARSTLSAGIDADGMGGVLATAARDLLASLRPRRRGVVDQGAALTLLLDGGHLRVSATAGPLPEGLEGRWVTDASHGVLASTLDGSTPGHETRPGPACELDRALGAPVAGDRHVTSLPLEARGQTLGTLLVISDDPLDESVLRTLTTLTTEGALALDGFANEQRLERRERLLSTVLAESHDVVAVLDADFKVRYVSPAIDRFGWEPQQVEGQSPSWMAHPEDLAGIRVTLDAVAQHRGASRSFEWRVRDARRRWHHIETVVTNHLDDPDLAGLLLNSRAITERKVLEDQLSMQARHDPLTGLPHRGAFEGRLEAALGRWHPGTLPPAVLYLDVDNLKHVNDTYGHWAGDQLLTTVARRLRSVTRGSDVAARVGGDEFAVVVENVDDTAVELVVNRVMAALRDGTEGSGLPSPQASVGIALARPGWSASQLVQAADAAMYAAKSSGKGHWRLYDDALPSPQDRSALVADLGHAIENDELAVHYQPLVGLPDRRPLSLEALARWQHPDRGRIPPNEFVPLAEQSGLIVPLGHRILTRALGDRAAWQGEDPHLALQVNLSSTQLALPQFPGEVEAALRAAGVPPTALTLEITETALIDNVDRTRESLRELRALGVRLSIDDFGAGYAGLGYLRDLPVDELKIDRSYVASLEHSPQGASLVRTVINLADSLGLDVVAEGIERESQANALVGMGCTRGQGYLFGAPAARQAQAAATS